METVKEDRSLATKTSHKAMSPAPSSLGKTAEEVSETQTALEEVRKRGHSADFLDEPQTKSPHKRCVCGHILDLKMNSSAKLLQKEGIK
jgi:hypothetical protein